jgi:predicted amidophosphoribosyltransferase
MGTEGHTAVMYRARPPAWLKGEVTRHCARCEGRVDWMQIVCPNCGAQLLKECPRCHCHVAMDTTFCTICRYSFPLPPPPKATVCMWHSHIVPSGQYEGL